MQSVLILSVQAGSLSLFDIASGVPVQSESAHDKEVWSLAMLPDKVGRTARRMSETKPI